MNVLERPARRVIIAIASVGLSALLFRGAVASALVLRGDDYLYAGNVRAAQTRYARALWLAPDATLAADRYAFGALLVHSKASLLSAVQVTSAALRRNSDPALFGDRALCYLALRRYGLAYKDFRAQAVLTRSPQAYTFAGWSALRSGDATAAAQMWKKAVAIAPAYRPARFALERVR